MLVEVATHGEAIGYEVPCLMVSAKDDLDSFPISIQESTRVRFLLISESMRIAQILAYIYTYLCTRIVLQMTQDMGIEPPVSISSKLGDFNNLFRKILTAAQHPHLSIPETEAGKSRKHYHRLINRSLMAVSSMFSFPRVLNLDMSFLTNKQTRNKKAFRLMFG